MPGIKQSNGRLTVGLIYKTFLVFSTAAAAALRARIRKAFRFKKRQSPYILRTLYRNEFRFDAFYGFEFFRKLVNFFGVRGKFEYYNSSVGACRAAFMQAEPRFYNASEIRKKFLRFNRRFIPFCQRHD
jgi:hypothetical protein